MVGLQSAKILSRRRFSLISPSYWECRTRNLTATSYPQVRYVVGGNVRQWKKEYPKLLRLATSKKHSSFSTVAAASASKAAIKTSPQTTPPLAVRTALVATTTAIGTPAFPVVGVVNFALRYIVFDKNTRYATLGVTTVLGGITTLLTMAANDWMPFVYSYSQLFLPFAVVNGALAGTAYAVLDIAMGTVAVVRTPWTGAVMGASVGLLGPVTGLYDKSFQWFYDIPEIDGCFTAFLSNGFVLPISITTGLGVGALMHPLMYFPVRGVNNIHWATFSAPLLAGATLFMAYLYHGDYFDDDIFPPETYLTSAEKRNLMLLSRFHAKSLTIEDWSPKTGYQPEGTGAQARTKAKEKLQIVQQHQQQAMNNRFQKIDLLFDSRRKAWLYYVTNGWIGPDLAVNNIPNETEMNQTSLNLVSADGAVAFLLPCICKQDGCCQVREGLLQLVEKLQTPSRSPERDKKRAKRTVADIEFASCGIAILFAELDEENKDINSKSMRMETPRSIHRQRQLEKLEQTIRKIAPGILLFRRDEGDGFKGCSVESQLKDHGWNGNAMDESFKAELWQKWKTGCDHREKQALANQFLWAVSGLTLALLYGLFGTSSS